MRYRVTHINQTDWLVAMRRVDSYYNDWSERMESSHLAMAQDVEHMKRTWQFLLERGTSYRWEQRDNRWLGFLTLNGVEQLEIELEVIE